MKLSLRAEFNIYDRVKKIDFIKPMLLYIKLLLFLDMSSIEYPNAALYSYTIHTHGPHPYSIGDNNRTPANVCTLICAHDGSNSRIKTVTIRSKDMCEVFNRDNSFTEADYLQEYKYLSKYLHTHIIAMNVKTFTASYEDEFGKCIADIEFERYNSINAIV